MICSTAQTLSDAAQVARRRPGGAALAVHVEHEAADRHRRIAAIADQVVPVGVAVLGDILAKRRQQVLRVLRGKVAFRQRRAQRHARGIVLIVAEQAAFEAVEMRELVGLRQRRMVGDVVGDAHELVERKDRAAMRRRDQPRGHGEILVPRALAGSQLCGVDRHDPELLASEVFCEAFCLEALACTRPFQRPPCPRA
jgi:hypothetical protein